MFIWLHWVLVAACGLSLVAVSGVYSLAAVSRLFIVVASLTVEHKLWGMWDSVIVACGLQSTPL